MLVGDEGVEEDHIDEGAGERERSSLDPLGDEEEEDVAGGKRDLGCF